MNESWIKLFRKFREWEWYQDGNVSRLFIELLLTVNTSDKNWQGILIKRGQILTGIEELGKRIGLNRQQTRTALDKLILTKEVTKYSTAKYTILTIEKFNDYQTITKSVTNEQPSSNQVVTTTKEYKKEKNILTIESECKQYLDTYNQVFSKNLRSYISFESNLKFWLKIYSIDEICLAVTKIKKDPYWGDKDISVEWLLRQADSKGKVDYIGRMLNNKSKKGNISEQMMEAYGL